MWEKVGFFLVFEVFSSHGDTFRSKMDLLKHKLNRILKKLDRIESLLEQTESKEEEKYLTEAEAKKLIGRGTTWFWQLRKTGFPHSKVGGTNYYKRSDLLKMLQDGVSMVEHEST